MDLTPFLGSLEGTSLDQVLLSVAIRGKVAIAMKGRFLLRAVCESFQDHTKIGCAVTDESTCLDYLAKEPYELLICTDHLESGSGFELARKARDCQAAVKDGILRLTNIGSECFLGFSAGKQSGPSTARFRIKAQAGASHFDWLPGGVGSKQQRTDFTMKGGDWEEVTVELHAEGPLSIVRLYLPMQEQAVEVDWIELSSENGQVTRTGF
jgi:hypothetical protein